VAPPILPASAPRQHKGRYRRSRAPRFWCVQVHRDHVGHLTVSLPVTISNGIKALLRFGFFVIAACTVLDCILFVALGYRYAKIVLFPVDPAKLETRSSYINFDLLYRNGTKTSSQFPPIRALPRALAQVSSKEPDRVYSQWPVSFLAPYGSVPQNDRRLLVDPEVNLLLLLHLDLPLASSSTERLTPN
jgi:hypothetical protein